MWWCTIQHVRRALLYGYCSLHQTRVFGCWVKAFCTQRVCASQCVSRLPWGENSGFFLKTSFESPVTGSTRGGYQSDLVKKSKTKRTSISVTISHWRDKQSLRHISSSLSLLKTFSGAPRHWGQARRDLQVRVKASPLQPLYMTQ